MIALVALSIAELIALGLLFGLLRSLYADAARSETADDKWSVTLSSEQINDPHFGERHTTIVTAPNGKRVTVKRLPDSPLPDTVARMTHEQLDEQLDERMTQHVRDAARAAARSLPPQTGRLR